MKHTYNLLLSIFLMACGNSVDSSENSSGSIFTQDYSPSEITGTWNVTMTCTYSDCEKTRNPGDIVSENWNVSYVNSEILVKVVGGENTSSEYTGQLNQDKLELKNKDRRGKTDVNLKIKSSTNMRGTRERFNSNGHNGPCSIKYEIEVTR